jgi:hypothetical protein
VPLKKSGNRKTPVQALESGVFGNKKRRKQMPAAGLSV